MSKQHCVTILVYHGQHGDQFWLTDTPERMEAAQRKLFTQLDDVWTCYDSDQERLDEARAGDIEAIRFILETRRNDEYEGWDIEAALDPLAPNA